ncbi:uncharacterized protein STEHIDRAFT_54256 [Stereum hirsutum FP-91666 SS1]|uniref:uncharacterized protein n=1 Tax=Stereum hirsutum (strain FP-91666) TaxID=721885 RepID=UPI000440E59C|nr:uncharacterized protein STEHIDRAFT_54256 [Stereum hirsutum FP-91666 SS1]EIM88578.1 hypothetical protein STEHIDRAFT_54256 [Stereum hirsutum FP-91666 SS1]
MTGSTGSTTSTSGSGSTPTPTASTSTITPATYAPTPKPSNLGGGTHTTTTGTLSSSSLHAAPVSPPPSNSRIPVTPAVLRAIFASSRSPREERSLSRVAFFRFTGFVISCLAISLAANRGRGIRSGAALLGVGVV